MLRCFSTKKAKLKLLLCRSPCSPTSSPSQPLAQPRRPHGPDRPAVAAAAARADAGQQYRRLALRPPRDPARRAPASWCWSYHPRRRRTGSSWCTRCSAGPSSSGSSIRARPAAADAGCPRRSSSRAGTTRAGQEHAGHCRADRQGHPAPSRRPLDAAPVPASRGQDHAGRPAGLLRAGPRAARRQVDRHDHQCLCRHGAGSGRGPLRPGHGRARGRGKTPDMGSFPHRPHGPDHREVPLAEWPPR